MPSNNRNLLAGLVALSMSVGGCAEVQRAAEDVARQSGNPRLAGAIHGAGNVVGSFLPIGYEEESSIGQAIALQVVARYGGVVDQPELVRYVNLVARAVANTSDRPDIPYRVAILDHESINAFAAPAGYIFVTRGLLKHIRNEAELAAVLGHEIAHVSEKHILEVIQRSKRLAGVTEAGLAYAISNPAAFKGVIDGAVKKLLDEGLDQAKETEADQVGEVFAARVGYDAQAYVALLTRLRDLKGDDRAFFKTHPDFSSRIDAVQQTIRTKHLTTTGLLLQERFARMTKRV
ncbi:MAG: M48 family metalloprotease [Nitrospira sp.]|jgi:predicted Zn-dependent protease|nr:MAG: M48 family metalloprotease [Nitrospira sp.]